MARILVVGGGIMGLGAAWRLAQAGRKVVLVEKAAHFGAGASNAAAGMIGPQSEALEDDAYFAATLVSRDLWPAFAEALSKTSSVELGFQAKGALHVAYGVSYEKRLDAKYLWQKRRAGLVERLEGDALFERFPMLARRTSCAFFAHGDYWVDNEALVTALVDACIASGVQLTAGIEVKGLDRQNGAWVATTEPALPEEAFDQVLVATGAWAGSLVPGTGLPIKGQMISFKVPPHLLPEVPLHAENVYLVPRGADRVLVGATVETVGFDTNLTGEGVEWLLQNAFETVPDLRSCAMDRFWAGLRPGSSDGWPSVGPGDQPGLHLCVGAYRRGILFAPLLVDAAVASVLGQDIPEAALAFRPRVKA